MQIVSFGELLIDFVALEMGVTVGEASGFIKAPGGAPANVAVAVARLGYDSAFMGQVGDDPFGHHLADILKAESVNVDGLSFSGEARTALAFVSNKADGDRSFMFYRHPSADMLMTADDVQTQVIDDSDIFHFGSITMIGEPSKSATLKAVQHAVDNDKFVSYDPNLRLPLWGSAEDAKVGMLEGFEYANFVKISDEELVFLTGGTDVAPLWRDRMEMLCVTYGHKGAVIHLSDGTTITHDGYHVKATDTTGAGDSFVAGMLTGILAHPEDYVEHLPSILDLANGIGALTTLQKGAIPSLPTMAQAKAFIAERKA